MKNPIRTLERKAEALDVDVSAAKEVLLRTALVAGVTTALVSSHLYLKVKFDI